MEAKTAHKIWCYNPFKRILKQAQTAALKHFYVNYPWTKKRNLYWILNFFAASSIFGCHFKVLMYFISKHLGDSWNLQDGFTNIGSGSRRFPISFSENRWQVVNLSRRWIYISSIFLERYLNIWQIFPICPQFSNKILQLVELYPR